MAETILKSESLIKGEVLLVLSEGEARALEAICGYGPDEFVKWFYKYHGKHYLQPHEKAMRSLFSTVKDQLPKHLTKLDKAREHFKELGLKYY